MKKTLLHACLVGAVLFSACKKPSVNNTVTPPITGATTTKFDTATTTVDGKTVSKITIKDIKDGVGTVTFKKNYVYILDGLVFVNSGQVLTIEPGTIIKGRSGQGEDASALVVARGGKIMAEGTAAEPIIFTGSNDETTRFTDGTLKKGTNLVGERGTWGGLIILGKGAINTTASEKAIEGISSTETRGLYGGGTSGDNTDNSGVLKYVSIRHGGTNIGADNEINGLTLAAVGSGTTIEYIEVVSNNDDGIEFFGGAPRVKYAVVSDCSDDSFDYDQGYNGLGQFWLAFQTPGIGDRLGEFDGDDDNNLGQPYAKPTLANITFIGNGSEHAKSSTFRANAGGKIYNAAYYNTVQGIDIERKIYSSSDKVNKELAENSAKRLETGDLMFNNVHFSKMTKSTRLVVYVDGKKEDGVSTIYDETAKDHKNVSTAVLDANDWALTLLNPAVSVAGTNVTTPSDSWFTKADYIGAFESNDKNWIKGWTALDQYGLIK